MEKTKKQVIMEAAARLFRDRGYPATSMRDLAEAVQLRASSLYNHIQSKQEILREICYTNAKRFEAGIEKVEANGQNAEEQVKALLALHIQVATEDLTSIISFNDEWRHLDEPDLSNFKQLRQDYERRFRQIIEKGMEEGLFVKGDTSIALYTLLSSVRWVYDWYKPGRSLDAKAVSDAVADIMMSGLRNKQR